LTSPGQQQELSIACLVFVGWDSAVGTATGYGLDGLVIEFR